MVYTKNLYSIDGANSPMVRKHGFVNQRIEMGLVPITIHLMIMSHSKNVLPHFTTTLSFECLEVLVSKGGVLSPGNIMDLLTCELRLLPGYLELSMPLNQETKKELMC